MMCLGSCDGEAPVKYQYDYIMLTPKAAASKHGEILR